MDREIIKIRLVQCITALTYIQDEDAKLDPDNLVGPRCIERSIQSAEIAEQAIREICKELSL